MNKAASLFLIISALFLTTLSLSGSIHMEVTSFEADTSANPSQGNSGGRYDKEEAPSRVQRIMKELSDPSSDYIAVIAHRGDWRNWPENSIPAIEAAIAMGADAVEVDAVMTKDGVLIICHDSSIDRTTTGKGKIRELTYDQICSYSMRAGNNIKKPGIVIPTLSDVMDVCKDRCLINIDRGFEYYPEILALAEVKGMTEQIIVNSKATPSEYSAEYSNHTMNLLYAPIVKYTDEVWPSKGKDFDQFIAMDEQFFAYEIVWDGTLDDVETIIEKVHSKGSLVWLNTLWPSMCGGETKHIDDDTAFYDPADVYSRFISLSPRIILSDRPALLLDYLRSSGHHTLRDSQGH